MLQQGDRSPTNRLTVKLPHRSSVLRLLFYSTQSATGTLALATLFTAAAILVLGGIVLLRARAQFVTFLFFVITVGASGWLAFFALMYGAESAAHATAFARVAAAFSSILPAATFHFAAAYVSRRRALQERSFTFCWMLCRGIALLEMPRRISSPACGIRLGLLPDRVRLQHLVGVIFAGMFAAAIRMLWRAAQSSEGNGARGARLLVAGFSIAMLAMIDFLPTLGFDVPPLGFIAILAFIAVAAHAVWRYHLIDLTPEYAAGQILETMKRGCSSSIWTARFASRTAARASVLGYPDGAYRQAASQHPVARART